MSDLATLRPGTRLGHLRIDRVLGQGAWGVTYLATDTASNQLHALKEYFPKALSTRDEDGRVAAKDAEASAGFESGLAAFLAEGAVAAGLDHPNVVSIERFFEANGTAYLQMPWYRGEPLHALLRRGGALDRAEVMALARPLLDALVYLHERKVVHRDIKPANIFITREGTPILLDFGAAANEASLGSEGYAAPEQSQVGKSVGPATDIYGLAATLYRCVSGRLPTPASERQAALDTGKTDPLPALDQLADQPGLGRLPDSIQSGLALDPARRPASAAAFRQALESTGHSIPGEEPEGREWLPMLLLAVFAVLLLSALGYLFLGEEDAEGPTIAAPTEAPEARRSPAEEALWRAALNADTAYGYQQFVERYPESIHVDQAIVHLERLDHQAWGRAQAESSRGAIESYLETFPEGLHAADAELLLNEIQLAEEAEQRQREEAARQDDAAWESARRTRTLGAVDRYLADWPGGLHVDEARDLRALIQRAADDRRAFEAAGKLHDKDAYQAYIDAFPGGAFVAQALEAIDGLTLRPGKSFRDCKDCPTMTVVPAGSYWQGANEDAPLTLKKETPRRMVTFDMPFAISVFEITFEQWDLCVAAGGCTSTPGDNGWGRGNRPVIMVSWNDAREYTAWLSNLTGQRYSLPSESQWEYAARAGEDGDWQGGSPAALCEFANVAGGESGFRWQHDGCSDSTALQTLPVGALRANAFGLHDTIGNVAEWTRDCMNLSYLDAPTDGSAWNRGICSSRMTRGGSWFTGSREIRLPARFNLKNGDRNDFTGFRVVRAVED
ncbi:MAG: SUMF1/EgtB/PvdO family nonheme iron enzyme [Xanthomonadales bacterium]|nr:SUMF1/EgtB/PvdO family nonheme iron enzyme [Gammaproteobacteria bacterium]MBT8051798.1 SUMF1/EgtB/PvdO family nonheme iron enzyme [Gammaproteobacteria bacterium]NNJ79762.1 SUMF1/EgtB/PvdO family nonheme iron enzyme [Xanthomonadales bacterium]NNL04860.1 SUMF1/EgtB/PvdO family nonheme iron enzyme [Xanthomonadales bacterium]